MSLFEQPDPEFTPFPSISRLFRGMVITEKLDGTNAQVCVMEDGRVFAGSRSKWLTLEADNFGFARWVKEHEEELLTLGSGQHFGEWWGSGIQRRYGLTEKRFSLFNVSRWGDPAEDGTFGGASARPACCHVVPTLYRGPFDTSQVRFVLNGLALTGSHAVPGFMNPEGIVIFHEHSSSLFKATLDKNDGHKSAGAPSVTGPVAPKA